MPFNAKTEGLLPVIEVQRLYRPGWQKKEEARYQAIANGIPTLGHPVDRSYAHASVKAGSQILKMNRCYDD